MQTPRQESLRIAGREITVTRNGAAKAHGAFRASRCSRPLPRACAACCRANAAQLGEYYRLALDGTESDWKLEMTPIDEEIARYVEAHRRLRARRARAPDRGARSRRRSFRADGGLGMRSSEPAARYALRCCCSPRSASTRAARRANRGRFLRVPSAIGHAGAAVAGRAIARGAGRAPHAGGAARRRREGARAGRAVRSPTVSTAIPRSTMPPTARRPVRGAGRGADAQSLRPEPRGDAASVSPRRRCARRWRRISRRWRRLPACSRAAPSRATPPANSSRRCAGWSPRRRPRDARACGSAPTARAPSSSRRRARAGFDSVGQAAAMARVRAALAEVAPQVQATLVGAGRVRGGVAPADPPRCPAPRRAIHRARSWCCSCSSIVRRSRWRWCSRRPRSACWRACSSSRRSSASVHAITLGFAATLIGESVDYPSYILLNTLPGETARRAARRVGRTLLLAVLTTVASALALTLSSFTGPRAAGRAHHGRRGGRGARIASPDPVAAGRARACSFRDFACR